MANYSLVVGSKFSPFSFQELLQPALMATQAHQDVENQYAELATKANVWEEMANSQTDPYAYKMYKTYSNDLEEQAGQLAREGLTPASRQNMLKMKQRYSRDIVPIEQAYKRRQELIDEQRKLLAQDNTLMFDRSASMLSLDDLIKNPNLTYQSYSGATLAKQVGTAAQSLAKEMRENPRKWRSILGNQYFESIMQKGYRPEEIIQVLQNDPNASSVLKSIVEDAVGSSNIASWGDQATLNRAYDYARQGLWNAVGDTQYQIQSNKDYDYDMQLRLAKAKKAQEKEAEGSRLYYRAVPKTTVDEDKNTKKLKEDLEYVKGLISGKNPMNEIRTRTKLYSSDPLSLYGTRGNLQRHGSSTEKYNYTAEQLNRFKNEYGTNNLEELVDKLDKEIKSSAVRSFSYKPNITQSDLITQVLKENTRSYYRRSNNTGLYELEDNKKGDAIDIEDLNSYFTSDSDIDFDPDLGFIINSTDSKGKTRSAVIDTELLDDPNRTFSKAQNSIRAALDNGEDELATLLIEATMKAFYDRYNTLEKRQSNTFSKE